MESSLLYDPTVAAIAMEYVRQHATPKMTVIELYDLYRRKVLELTEYLSSSSKESCNP